MPVIPSAYSAPLFLPNGHFQTIYPALFRKTKPDSTNRERIITPDHDFLDLDWSFSKKKTTALVIITHGLEGSSSSPYILGMKSHFLNLGMDVIAWNFRGCSGEVNKCLRFYHSGETGDLEYVINYSLSSGKYMDLFLIGFSLGGNVTLKMLGEKAGMLPKELRGATAISVPCHLASSAETLGKWENIVYLRRFLKSLRTKIRLKAPFFPDHLNCEDIDSIRNFKEFDDRFTAPLHGFTDAAEYWEKNSSRQYLSRISTPTLLLNARNDPFLSDECYPFNEAENHKKLFLEAPKQGGHCGFYLPGNIYYSEKRAAEFFRSILN